MSGIQISIHCSRPSEKSAKNRIGIRSSHYENTWSTVAITVDEQQITWFLHDIDMMREFASKLEALSQRLFEIVATQEIIARAHQQAANVG